MIRILVWSWSSHDPDPRMIRILIWSWSSYDPDPHMILILIWSWSSYDPDPRVNRILVWSGSSREPDPRLIRILVGSGSLHVPDPRMIRILIQRFMSSNFLVQLWKIVSLEHFLFIQNLFYLAFCVIKRACLEFSVFNHGPGYNDPDPPTMISHNVYYYY